MVVVVLLLLAQLTRDSSLKCFASFERLGSTDNAWRALLRTTSVQAGRALVGTEMRSGVMCVLGTSGIGLYSALEKDSCFDNGDLCAPAWRPSPSVWPRLNRPGRYFLRLMSLWNGSSNINEFGVMTTSRKLSSAQEPRPNQRLWLKQTHWEEICAELVYSGAHRCVTVLFLLVNNFPLPLQVKADGFPCVREHFFFFLQAFVNTGGHCIVVCGIKTLSIFFLSIG